MSQTLTNRVEAIKNDDAENVLIEEINDAFDKFDNHFIPAAKLLNSGTQSVPNNAVTTAAFNTVAYDTYSTRSEGAMANAGTETITIRKAGLYVVTFAVSFAANATGVRRRDIAKNGTSLIATANPGYLGSGNSDTVSGTYLFAVNDAITAKVFQTSGGALDADGNTFAEGFSLSVVWAGTAVEV